MIKTNKNQAQASKGLEAVASYMEPGTRVRIVCPKCRGGDSQEESLSLYRDYTKKIAWKCFRAKCSFSGNQGVGLNSSQATTSSSIPKYFTAPYVPAKGTPAGKFIEERFGFSGGANWSDAVRRYVLPVRGPNMHLRGNIAYSFEQTPKTLNYRERVEEPFVHYTLEPFGFHSTVIVEDWWSCQKVYLAGARGVSLNGTILNRVRVDELKAAAKGTQVVLALDADAYAKSVKYVIDYGGGFDPPMKLWKLKTDLKYESISRIQGALNDGRGDFTIGSNAKGQSSL